MAWSLELCTYLGGEAVVPDHGAVQYPTSGVHTIHVQVPDDIYDGAALGNVGFVPLHCSSIEVGVGAVDATKADGVTVMEAQGAFAWVPFVQGDVRVEGEVVHPVELWQPCSQVVEHVPLQTVPLTRTGVQPVGHSAMVSIFADNGYLVEVWLKVE